MDIKDERILERILKHNSPEDVINEIVGFEISKYSKIDNTPFKNIDNDINEMARINLDEGSNNIFPYNKFDVRIWSNDHMPMHFHVLSEGWDISFTIVSGELYRINRQGDNKKIYKYIVSNVKKWLNSESAIAAPFTNAQNAKIVWRQLHDNK